MKEHTEIKVWDPLLRLFHWSLVLSFAVAYATEDDLMEAHLFAGYLILGLLGFRLLWGVVGPRYARFTDFVRPPKEAVAYLKQMTTFHAKRHLGHNPAGGAMVIALLASLFVTALTGLGADGTLGFGTELMEEIHEFFASFTLLLVAVHVAGVLFSSLIQGENLVRAMINGRKYR